jgi:hypothetical protein
MKDFISFTNKRGMLHCHVPSLFIHCHGSEIPWRQEINRALTSAAPEPSSHREVLEEHGGSA